MAGSVYAIVAWDRLGSERLPRSALLCSATEYRLSTLVRGVDLEGEPNVIHQPARLSGVSEERDEEPGLGRDRNSTSKSFSSFYTSTQLTGNNAETHTAVFTPPLDATRDAARGSAPGRPPALRPRSRVVLVDMSELEIHVSGTFPTVYIRLSLYLHRRYGRDTSTRSKAHQSPHYHKLQPQDSVRTALTTVHRAYVCMLYGYGCGFFAHSRHAMARDGVA